MHNSVSEQSFSNEGDEEEDEEKEFNKGEDNGNDSDSSNYSNNNQQQSKPIYLNTTRPQICSRLHEERWAQGQYTAERKRLHNLRQSIDLYCRVPSPSITSLGTSKLSRLSSPFPSLSLTRRHTHEIFPSATQPLLPTAEDEQKPHHRQSSVSLLPPTPSRRGSGRKSSVVTHGLPVSGRSSFGQAVVNGMNVLCGVGILSTPYAVKQGGWAGLSVLAIFAVLSFYTGLLLCRCLDSQPGLETYPDIGQAAFGTLGRLAISIILYAELYACCVEYIILESDNLSSLFPNARLNLGGFVMNSHQLFALLATIAILPTVWLRDLTMLSYISVGGVIASILAVLCLFWVGLVDKVGFQTKGAMLNLTTLPVAIGLYGYCYSGHAVFPNIYASMQKKSQFPAVLLTCFVVCTLMYAGVAVMGYLMFGESALSQFTLNLPQDLVAAKIAVWTTVVNPFTKYALTMTPIAMCLEELMPPNKLKSHKFAILIRTALVISTLVVGLTVPFFGPVMALIGSLLTMLITLILPCACYLSILRGKTTRFQVSVCILIIAVGVVSAVFGTSSALSNIVENLRS